MIYERWVKKYLPFHKVKEKVKKKTGLPQKYKNERDRAWTEMKKNNWKQKDYKIARNVYVRVRREEEKKYGKDRVDMYKEEPKLFYRFINGKLKQRKCSSVEGK